MYGRFLRICAFFALCLLPPTQAAAVDSCGVILTLTGLPHRLHEVRHGGGDPAVFKRNLSQVLGQISSSRAAAVFSKDELRTMRIFSGAVREDWKLNGANANARKIPGLTTTSSTIDHHLRDMIVKFDCDIRGSGGSAFLKTTRREASTVMSLLVGMAIIILMLLAAYRFLFVRRHSARKLCRVPAMLHCNGKAWDTVVLDISRGGAMIMTPEGTPAGSVRLELPGHDMEARIAWKNSNFMGLIFERTIPKRAVDEIAGMRGEEPPDDLEVVPSGA